MAWFVALCLLATSVLGGFLLPIQQANAATTSTLNFQARLESSTGAIVPDGLYNVEFKLYTASAVDGGETPIAGSCTTNPGAVADEDCVWTERYYDSDGAGGNPDNRVSVQNGYLTVNLGSQTSFPGTINWDQDLWIAMNIGGLTHTSSPTWDGEMSPRMRLTGVPYAFRAGMLATAHTSNGFTSTLALLQPTVGNQTFQVLDQTAAGTYTICVQGATTALGGCAPTTGGAGYIQNGTGGPQVANFNIQSAAAGNVGAIIQGHASQSTDIFRVSTATLSAVAVNADGEFLAGLSSQTVRIGNSATGIGSVSLVIGQSSSTSIGIVLKGGSGQTADLLQNMDVNKTILSGIGANGNLYTNGTANTMSGLAYPATVSISNVGTAGSTTYGYRVSALNSLGETIAAPTATTATGNASLNGSDYNVVTFSPVAGATSYKVYGRTSGSELFMATVTSDGRTGNYTYNDTGAETPSGALPTGSTLSPVLSLSAGGTSGQKLLDIKTASGTSAAYFNGIGNLYTSAGISAAGTIVSGGAVASLVGISAGTTATVQVNKGVAAQTGDLLQFQDANNAILGGTNANGGLYNYGVSNTFSNLAVPAFSTVSNGSNTYYVITATNAAGETVASASLGMANSSSTLAWTQVPGATGYKIYRNSINDFTSGSLLRTTITNGTTVSFVDNGAALTAGLPPTTTSGTGMSLQAWNGQTADLLALKDSTNAILAKFDASGNLTSGTINSGAITSSSTITGTTVNGTIGINTGASAGTQRIDASGNLLNIGNYSAVGSYLQKSDSATAFRLQNTSSENALLFDGSTKKLRIYENVASPSRYAEIYYDNATSSAVFAASSGTTQVGGIAAGNIALSTTAIGDLITATHTGTASGAYTSNDITLTRNLVGGANALQGSVVKIEDLSTYSGGSSSPNVLLINQNNTGATGYLILAQTGGSTTKFSVSTAGLVNAIGGYAVNGTAGATTTCTSGDVLTNQVVQGGVVTGGTCAANGSGGGANTALSNLASVDINASLTTSTNNTLNIGGASNAFANGYFGTAVMAPLFDTASAVALNIGTTNATVINLNEDTSLAAGKSLTLVGSGTRPGSPTGGMLYYDTTTKQLLVYDDTATYAKWRADRESNTKIVAASNSSQAAKDAADYIADGNTGAAADGDQVQINAALTAAAGGKVYLLEGTYVADATILIPDDTTLAGSGNGSLIELADLDATDNLMENSNTSTGTGVVIQDLKLDGRKDLNTAGTQHGIYFSNMGGGSGSTARQGAEISGITATRFRNDAIYLTASSNNSVTSNTILGNNVVAISLNAASAYNNVITNTLHDNATGVLISGNGSDYNTVANNVGRGNGGGYGISLSSADWNTITGNEMENNASGIRLSDSRHNTLSANITHSNTSNGIYLTFSSFLNTINNNKVHSNTSTGMYIEESDFNSINGNSLSDNGGSTTNNAIFLIDSNTNSVTSNVITDTSASSNNYAINITFNIDDSNDTYLSDNTLGSGSVSDGGLGTIFANQLNVTNQLVNRSSGGLVVQNASKYNIINADYTNSQLVLGQSSSLSGKMAFANSTNANTVTFVSGTTSGSYTLTLPTALGSSGDCLKDTTGTGVLGFGSCGGGGGGGATRTIVLSPEYAGATIWADGSNNNGTLTSDYDSTSPGRNYYSWTNSTGALNDYDVVVRTAIPSDYASGFGTLKIYAYAASTSSANNDIKVTVKDSAGTTCASAVSVLPGSATTWTQSATITLSGCTFTANSMVTIMVHMESKSSNAVRIGDISYQYTN